MIAMIEAGGAAEESTGQETESRRGSNRLARRSLLLGAAATVVSCALAAQAAAATAAERRLMLYNPHTDERFHDVYWHGGEYVPESLTRIDWLMRDFHRDVAARIDPTLIDLLHAIQGRLGTHQPLSILSGFRTPATNRLLRREGLGAAAHSFHLQAQAADIDVERLSLKHLRGVALSLKAGGVGTYWRDRFVHVDVGPPRSW